MWPPQVQAAIKTTLNRGSHSFSKGINVSLISSSSLTASFSLTPPRVRHTTIEEKESLAAFVKLDRAMKMDIETKETHKAQDEQDEQELLLDEEISQVNQAIY